MNLSVSVITPTREREWAMEPLYRLYESQTYACTELLVCDDSVVPSAFMTRVQRKDVKYLRSAGRMTIGAKRDWLVREASGDVIVQFDDDDYYSPSYVETMVERLQECAIDLVKLDGWFLFDCGSSSLFYWDTCTVMPAHFRVASRVKPAIVSTSAIQAGQPDLANRQRWGYGFSYVFRRAIYGALRFDVSMDHGEDYRFVECARSYGAKVMSTPDEFGLALHIVHDDNTSNTYPNYRLPRFCFEKYFGAAGHQYLERAGQLRSECRAAGTS